MNIIASVPTSDYVPIHANHKDVYELRDASLYYLYDANEKRYKSITIDAAQALIDQARGLAEPIEDDMQLVYAELKISALRPDAPVPSESDDGVYRVNLEANKDVN